MVVALLFSPGMKFDGHTIEAVLPVEGEIQKYRLEREGGGRSILYCRIRKDVSEDDIIAFIGRAQSLGVLSHRNLPRIEGAGYAQAAGFYWMRVKAPSGVSLRELMDGGEELGDEASSLALFQRVALVLEWARDRGFAHFGLTPSHIYVRDAEDLELDLVMGLGVRMVLDAAPSALQFEERLYRAPEQLRREDADLRADIYALGMILYTLLAEGPPYAEQFAEAGIQNPSVAPLAEITPILELSSPSSLCEVVDLEPLWNAFIFRLIAKAAPMRYPTWKVVTSSFNETAGAVMLKKYVDGTPEDRERIDHELAIRGGRPLSSLPQIAKLMRSSAASTPAPGPVSGAAFVAAVSEVGSSPVPASEAISAPAPASAPAAPTASAEITSTPEAPSLPEASREEPVDAGSKEETNEPSDLRAEEQASSRPSVRARARARRVGYAASIVALLVVLGAAIVWIRAPGYVLYTASGASDAISALVQSERAMLSRYEAPAPSPSAEPPHGSMTDDLSPRAQVRASEVGRLRSESGQPSGGESKSTEVTAPPPQGQSTQLAPARETVAHDSLAKIWDPH